MYRSQSNLLASESAAPSLKWTSSERQNNVRNVSVYAEHREAHIGTNIVPIVVLVGAAILMQQITYWQTVYGLLMAYHSTTILMEA